MTTTLLVREPSATELNPSIGVCSDQVVLLERISAALREAGLAVSHRCSNLATTVDACEQHDLDVMVIGARRSDRATLDLVSSLSRTNPDVRVVIACERSPAGDIRKALDAGARGIVPADDVDEVLVPVLRVVFAGQVSVPGPRGREVGKRVLTTREKQILGLVITGMTNAQIASRFIPCRKYGVKSHLSSSFAKLGVASRNEAAAFIHDPVRGRGLGIPRFHPNNEFSEQWPPSHARRNRACKFPGRRHTGLPYRDPASHGSICGRSMRPLDDRLPY